MANTSLPGDDPVNRFNPNEEPTNTLDLLSRIKRIERRLDGIEKRHRTPEMKKSNIVFGTK